MAEAVSVERLADVGMAYLERSRLACLLDRSDAELQRCVTAARAALRTRDSELAKLLEEMVVPDGEWTYLPAECKLVRAQ